MNRKAIAVISGKGGVGKTTLTASLASLSAKDPELHSIILDCDVDAPNLALLLPPDSEENVDSIDVYTTLKATFFDDKCVHCKDCIESNFCEFSALTWNEEDSVPEIDYLRCEGCGACKVLCPEHAFEIDKVISGEIIAYPAKIGVPMIYGKTRLGSTTSGKMVSEIKTYAQNIEEFPESNFILIDGPPGIGCPTIATISGLDYIITITEPTPSGLHDLLRAIEIVQHFGIPFGIIVNKYDIQSSFQEEFGKLMNSNEYNILGQIPFDLAIPNSISYAKAVVDYEPESKASKAIREIYLQLKQVLDNLN